MYIAGKFSERKEHAPSQLIQKRSLKKNKYCRRSLSKIQTKNALAIAGETMNTAADVTWQGAAAVATGVGDGVSTGAAYVSTGAANVYNYITTGAANVYESLVG
jgi:hypothetical protein